MMSASVARERGLPRGLEILAIRMEGAGKVWVSQSADPEREAAPVLRDWIQRPTVDGWRHRVRITLTLAGRPDLSVDVDFHGELPGSIRSALVSHLRSRSRKPTLTDSHKRALRALADALEGTGIALPDEGQWAHGGSRRALCACGTHVPWRWAAISGLAVRVPAVHMPLRGLVSNGVCPRVEDAYRELDLLVPWDLEATQPTTAASSRELWWQKVLATVPAGLQPLEGAT
jgi:hypothetical protein